MFILCPHCQFLVALDPVSGQPPQRCPRCDGSLQSEPEIPLPAAAATAAWGFDATPPETDAHAKDDVAPAAGQADPDSEQSHLEHVAPEHVAPEHVDLEHADSMHSDPEQAETEHADASTAANLEAVADSAAASLSMARKRAPSFVRAPPTATTKSVRQRWRLPASIIGLTLLLLLQMMLADRTQLAADARWRPAVSALCDGLRCTVPPWREPGAFTLLDRDVRPHPGVAGVLRVTASFRNDARWPQRWPSLLLTLSDVDGRVAGRRLFSAHEYLAGASTQNGLASGQSASIVMDVMEPAPRVVAFTFDFR